MWTKGTFAAGLMLALCIGQPPAWSAEGEGSQARVDQDGETQEVSRDSTGPAERKNPVKHPSCRELCLADGEDPLDCESFCVQVVDVGTPADVAALTAKCATPLVSHR